MKRLLVLGVMIAAAAALAACGSSGGNGSATAATPNSSGQAVSVANISGAGRVLVDSNGQALYASDQEKSGKVMCTTGCTSIWMPLTVKGGAPSASGVSGLGTVKRPDDGAMQVTYKGMPLYSFTQEGPGEVTGDGFHDAFNGQQFTWHMVSVGMGSGSGSSSSGNSAASSSGGGYSY
jgi:predicted lipoprotein with Yx(FWY)xxD motif